MPLKAPDIDHGDAAEDKTYPLLLTRLPTAVQRLYLHFFVLLVLQMVMTYLMVRIRTCCLHFSVKVDTVLGETVRIICLVCTVSFLTEAEVLCMWSQFVSCAVTVTSKCAVTVTSKCE